MEVLLLGGVFSYDYQNMIMKKSKGTVNFAANEYQIKLIKGFKECGIPIKVLSAPFIGAYPQRYCDIYFKKFDNDELTEYVSFLNLWGIRNFARSYSLKKKIKNFTKETDRKKVIIVYSPHTPFLEVASYAKKINPKIHICLIVPDLPQYMNLESKHRKIYDFFKKFDIERFNKLKKIVDSFTVLTDQMADALEIKNKPYIVVEGLVDENNIQYTKVQSKTRTIVYTGTLNKKFGVLNLVEAFKRINDKELNLIICGEGETKEDIVREAKKDNRIKFLGQVTIEESKRIQKEATVLVNPRQNNEEYTKYSFPSKTMEYLETGNPVIAYKLDGIPNEYQNYLIYVKDNSIEELANSIMEAINISEDNRNKKRESTINFLKENKTNEKRCKEILNMIEEIIK